MHLPLRALAVGLAALAALPASAQQQQTEAAPSRSQAEPRQPYEAGTFQDWRVRCIRIDEASADPCEMKQTLFSEDGSPTAEMTVLQVPDNQQAAAAATFVTPLETLLPRGLRFSIDDGEAKTYQFRFCTRQGCVAQVGFTQSELDRLKAGAEAQVRIFPVAAPETPVDLTVSLAGFTNAFAALSGVPGIE